MKLKMILILLMIIIISGCSQDLYFIDEENFSTISVINSSPNCNESSRGLIYILPGAINISDNLEVCLKNSSNNFTWFKLN